MHITAQLAKCGGMKTSQRLWIPSLLNIHTPLLNLETQQAHTNLVQFRCRYSKLLLLCLKEVLPDRNLISNVFMHHFSSMAVIHHLVSFFCAQYVQQAPRSDVLLNVLVSPEISLSELILAVSSWLCMNFKEHFEDHTALPANKPAGQEQPLLIMS